MGITKEEYQRRVRRKAETSDSNGHTYFTSRSGGNSSKGKHCKHCGMSNHNTVDCRWLGSSKCGTCGRFGHESTNCHNKRKLNNNNQYDEHQKKQRMEQSNEANKDSDEEEHIVC